MASITTIRSATDPIRRPAQLAARLDKSLSAYAAAAAGVGLMTLGNPAEAKVVFTPSNIPISENTGLIHLDLNNDGIADFAFSATSRFGSARPPLGLYAASLLVMPEHAGNEIGAMSSKGFQCAAKLRGKVAVGPGRNFKSIQLTMLQVAGDYTNQFSAHCPWVNRAGGFLGLKFVISGETHYGWARIVEFGTKFAAIRGYAYETVPDKPIMTGAISSPESADAQPALPAPQPASLGVLATGAPGLNAWRGALE